MRPWRGIVLKKISTRGRSLQLQAAPDRSYRDRASTSGSRLKPLRRRFRNHGEHREHGGGKHTRCSQGGRGNHAWGQTGSGACDTGQPPACGDSWLPAISAGLRSLRQHREAERCVIASSTHPTGYRLISLRARSDLRGSIPPVLSPWSMPTGELTPWPPQHRSKPIAAMPKRAAGRKPRRGRPACGATPSNMA